MKRVGALPEGYKEYYSVNLQKNKKVSMLLNGASLLIMIAMIIPMNFLVPIKSFFDVGSLKFLLIKYAIFIGSLILYIW